MLLAFRGVSHQITTVIQSTSPELWDGVLGSGTFGASGRDDSESHPAVLGSVRWAVYGVSRDAWTVGVFSGSINWQQIQGNHEHCPDWNCDRFGPCQPG